MHWLFLLRFPLKSSVDAVDADTFEFLFFSSPWLVFFNQSIEPQSAWKHFFKPSHVHTQKIDHYLSMILDVCHTALIDCLILVITGMKCKKEIEVFKWYNRRCNRTRNMSTHERRLLRRYVHNLRNTGRCMSPLCCCKSQFLGCRHGHPGIRLCLRGKNTAGS